MRLTQSVDSTWKFAGYPVTVLLSGAGYPVHPNYFFLYVKEAKKHMLCKNDINWIRLKSQRLRKTDNHACPLEKKICALLVLYD